METLHVEIELHCEHQTEAELIECIKDAITSNESEFYELMGRTCRKIEMRAEISEESLEVSDVSMSASGGVVSVEYEYSAYYGCKDADHSDYLNDDWKFHLDNNKLIFDLSLPEVERYDEY